MMWYSYCAAFNKGAPPSKTKYNLKMSFSEQVPWGKGEKDTDIGVKRGKISS